MAAIDPLTAGAVLLATAATDAVYVMFTSAVVARKRVPAATWSSVWYVLSSYAVISYTENWVYVAFAAVGSWLGAYASITYPAPATRRPTGGRVAGVTSLVPRMRCSAMRFHRGAPLSRAPYHVGPPMRNCASELCGAALHAAPRPGQVETFSSR